MPARACARARAGAGLSLPPSLSLPLPFSISHLERPLDQGVHGRVRRVQDVQAGLRGGRHQAARPAGHEVADQRLGGREEGGGRGGGGGGGGGSGSAPTAPTPTAALALGQELDGGQAGVRGVLPHGLPRGRDPQEGEGAAGRVGRARVGRKQGRRCGGGGRHPAAGLVEKDDGVPVAGQEGVHRIPGGSQRPFGGGDGDVIGVRELKTVWGGGGAREKTKMRGEGG